MGGAVYIRFVFFGKNVLIEPERNEKLIKEIA